MSDEIEVRDKKMLDLEEQLRADLTQCRVCEKLESRIVESNFIICLKKMFNKDYKPKTKCWWSNRSVIDVPRLQALVYGMLSYRRIDFTDVFVRYTNMSLDIYILYRDHKYYCIAL